MSAMTAVPMSGPALRLDKKRFSRIVTPPIPETVFSQRLGGVNVEKKRRKNP